MDNSNIGRAMSAIGASTRRKYFSGAKTEELISKAEQRLGLAFPASYRQFLAQYGAGSVGSLEIYGVIADDFDAGAVPDGVWLTLKRRLDSALPKNLMIIGDVGDGSYYCIMDAASGGGVVVFDPGSRMSEAAYTSFDEYVIAQLEE